MATLGAPQGVAVAVVGAGVSGLVCARALVDGGIAVRLFEKARGPWGRLATRRSDAGAGWDFGAQYFTVRDSRFEVEVRRLESEGLVSPWEGRIVALDAERRARPVGGGTRWVGVPGMSALGLALGRGLEIATGVRVGRVEPRGEGLAVLDTAGLELGVFPAVVLALPAPQAASLVREADPALSAALEAVPMEPCWAALLETPARVELAWDGAFTETASEVLGWVARDSSKPGRKEGERWVLHARPDWSARHLEDGAEDVASSLRAAFQDLVGGRVEGRLETHRWRYARGASPVHGPLVGASGRVVACGDWAAGGRVEGAWLSGLAAAAEVLGRSGGPERSRLVGAGTAG